MPLLTQVDDFIELVVMLNPGLKDEPIDNNTVHEILKEFDEIANNKTRLDYDKVVKTICLNLKLREKFVEPFVYSYSCSYCESNQIDLCRICNNCGKYHELEATEDCLMDSDFLIRTSSGVKMDTTRPPKTFNN